ncbi:NAD(P)H-dependent oxidoreductase [Streptomyces sp. NPDC096193]|uniref:NAD(P)H-dependent oxidoreductase n=1 Tax=Streptomyces sp. NPDC096193 TaxID=3155821 RepID=UPI003333B8C9
MVVTPEYSLSPSGALSNAVDFLYAEWTIKAVGFVGHGSAGEAPARWSLRRTAGSSGWPMGVRRARCRSSRTSRASAGSIRVTSGGTRSRRHPTRSSPGAGRRRRCGPSRRPRRETGRNPGPGGGTPGPTTFGSRPRPAVRAAVCRWRRGLPRPSCAAPRPGSPG